MNNLIEQQESLSFMPTDSIAINERESNGFIYPLGKPSISHINELRQQKKARREEMLKTEETSETIISEELKILPTTRKDKRQEIENRISQKILLFFKNSQGFTKKDLSFLFSDIKAERTKRELTSKILKNLSLMGKVKKTIRIAKIKQLQNKPLFSNDMGSFQLMMKANGYKYDAENQSYSKSSKPIEKQGVYTNSNMSVCAYDIPYNKAVYELI